MEWVKKISQLESLPGSLVWGAFTALIFWVLYKILTLAVKRYLVPKVLKPESELNFLLVWRYVWIVVASVFVLGALSGSFAALGISAAFLGMILGWSLQAPVTGIAAWFMIMLKRPFKLGDRIIIDGIVGDVTDITLTHIVLNQVGGTIGGEERSGRGVLIPNATLFNKTIHNYSFQGKYILDEVPILLTYESDLDEAEKILVAAAGRALEALTGKTREEPFVRAEFADSGVRLRLRYQARAVERQKISSTVVREVIKAVGRSRAVEFAYPHLELVNPGLLKKADRRA